MENERRGWEATVLSVPVEGPDCPRSNRELVHRREYVRLLREIQGVDYGGEGFNARSGLRCLGNGNNIRRCGNIAERWRCRVNGRGIEIGCA